MAQAADVSTTSRFHNLSNEMLADAIGNADAVLKRAEAECKALKDEFKSRGLLDDTRAIQAYLGHRNIQNTTRYTALAPLVHLHQQRKQFVWQVSWNFIAAA
jgi:integrase